jgi:hypothetical protein
VELYYTCKSQIQQPGNKESETGIKEEKRKKWIKYGRQK